MACALLINFKNIVTKNITQFKLTWPRRKVAMKKLNYRIIELFAPDSNYWSLNEKSKIISRFNSWTIPIRAQRRSEKWDLSKTGQSGACMKSHIVLIGTIKRSACRIIAFCVGMKCPATTMRVLWFFFSIYVFLRCSGLTMKSNGHQET